jgi:cytochrome b subunit of formate dehydrogenase
MDNNDQTLGVIAIVLAGLSFFITNFIFAAAALILAAIATRKNELHWFAIVLAVISILIDIAAFNSYY